MNNEITTVLPRLVGKTISHVVLKEGKGPRAQLFLVFADGTYYEFYADSSIDGAAGIDRGGLSTVLASGKPNQSVVFQC
jgi:hypothetical protein